MSGIDIYKVVETVQNNKPLIMGAGFILSVVIFLLTKNTKSVVDYYLGSALQQVGKGKKLRCPLTKKEKLSHDTYRFVFKLPKEDQTLGINVGQHIAIVQNIKTKECPDGEEITRKYTPVSPVTQKGTFDLVIKVYHKNVHPRFPEGGILTQWMETLEVGDSIDITGPTGRLVYNGDGNVVITNFGEAPQKQNFKRILMVGGGTGITPLYQVVQAIAAKTGDSTEAHLLYANKTEEDILIRQELEQQQEAGNLKLSYTLDNPPKEWKQFSGFITAEMLSKAFPAYAPDTLICTCGPPMMNKLVVGLFKDQGYKTNQIFQF